MNAIKQTKGEQCYAIKPSLHLPNFFALNYQTSSKIVFNVQRVTIHGAIVLNILNIEHFLIAIAFINYQIDLNIKE